MGAGRRETSGAEREEEVIGVQLRHEVGLADEKGNEVYIEVRVQTVKRFESEDTSEIRYAPEYIEVFRNIEIKGKTLDQIIRLVQERQFEGWKNHRFF